MGSGIPLFFLAVLDIFFGSAFLPIFLLFAASWSWKLPFQLSLQYFVVGTFHFRFCNILVEFVTCWSWKLPFQRSLRHF